MTFSSKSANLQTLLILNVFYFTFNWLSNVMYLSYSKSLMHFWKFLNVTITPSLIPVPLYFPENLITSILSENWLDCSLSFLAETSRNNSKSARKIAAAARSGRSSLLFQFTVWPFSKWPPARGRSLKRWKRSTGQWNIYSPEIAGGIEFETWSPAASYTSQGRNNSPVNGNDTK